MSTQVVEAGDAVAPSAAEPTPADASARAAHPWRRAWIVGSATWAGAALMYTLVSALSWMVADQPGPNAFHIFEAWDHWDTGHYMRISQEGYTTDRPDAAAFFPLFPALLRAVDTVLPGSTLLAALVLANAACVGALVMLHRFTAREFDAATADRALLFLMAFPTAFFLSAGYNGSLYLLLSVSVLYLVRGQRWWAAGAVGALASATRLAGALLVLVFVLEYGRRQGWRLRALRPDALAVALIPLGLVAFAGFCWVRLGDPFAFTHAQDAWGRQTAPPWTGPMQALDTISLKPLLEQVTVHNLIDVVAAAGAALLLLLCVVGPWRLPRDQISLVVYAAVSLLVVLVSPAEGLFPMMGTPRYILELVPIFLLLARLGAHRTFERVYLLPAVGVQAVFLLTFLNDVWVA